MDCFSLYPSYAQRAAQDLLIKAPAIENTRGPSTLVRELARKIKEHDFFFRDTEIKFYCGRERIKVQFSRNGDLVLFDRSGGFRRSYYDRRLFYNAAPLAKYVWSRNPHDPITRRIGQAAGILAGGLAAEGLRAIDRLARPCHDRRPVYHRAPRNPFPAIAPRFDAGRLFPDRIPVGCRAPRNPNPAMAARFAPRPLFR